MSFRLASLNLPADRQGYGEAGRINFVLKNLEVEKSKIKTTSDAGGFYLARFAGID